MKNNKINNNLTFPLYKKGKGKYSAFTLVELIVVITILAILGTIAFISLQGYSQISRDSVRISDIGNLAKMLEISMTVGDKVPKPENAIELTASGTLIGYQGEAGVEVLSILGMFNGGKDPLEETYYTYATNEKLNKYQVLGFLEDGSELSENIGNIKNTYAKDLSKRYVYTKGNEIGVLLDPVTSEPANKGLLNIDVVNTTSEYKVTFNATNEVNGTGGILYSTIYNNRKDLLLNKEYAKLDDSLVLYFDMETLSGTTLKDLSKYGNDGYCYNSGTLVNCGSGIGPQIVDGYGKSGKAMSFDGVDDYMYGKVIDLSVYNNFTYNIIAKPLSDHEIDNQDYLVRGTSGQKYLIYPSYMGGYSSTYAGGGISLGKNGVSYYEHSSSYMPALLVKEDSINSFTNISISYKDNVPYLYINGILVKKGLKSSKARVYPGFIIGGQGYGFFNGIIDEVRIYNRALSDTEIKALYNSTK